MPLLGNNDVIDHFDVEEFPAFNDLFCQAFVGVAGCQVSGGVIVAKISGSTVTINISSLNETTVKVSVKARKFYMPRINLAQDIFVKIMSNVNG